MEAGQVLSLSVGCQHRGSALSASDKLRVNTLEFAGAQGLCIPSGHDTRHTTSWRSTPLGYDVGILSGNNGAQQPSSDR
ncbi:hypothetical protein KUCAC02_017141 [Chaenocephalus aceratus]|uniref:Uncharacterized protein n=1 Tax=Chaenocephalus aceratus TaxID=36190 RepID=A0ACB9W0W6_CHAAC|nr:hypothetical protein KUCAC02_017141 [Chaenocephalus aceratus]